MGFAHIQGNSNVGGASITTLSLTLTTAPLKGNLVCVGLTFASASTISALAVKDGNNNAYTISPSSPSPTIAAGYTYQAYLLSAPANASPTITATWTTTNSGANIYADEFSVTGGSAVFDVDAKASSTVGSTINTPTITPSNAGELLYATASAGGTITTANTPWTGSAGAIQSGDWSEYDLSASAATAVNFTETGGTGWSTVAMAFNLAQFLINVW